MGFFSKLAGSGKMKPQPTTSSKPLCIQDPTIGFLNLLGEKGDELLAADRNKLAPLLAKSEVSTEATPKCQVLFLYGTLQVSGEVVGSISLRDLIREAGAYVAVVASENPADSYIKGAGSRDSRWSANIVMCLDRRGDKFAQFFVDLFKAMFDGTSMPVAWVNIAPQIQGKGQTNTPESIMSAEAGQIVFSRSR
jgi:hypothetical protein